MIYFDAAFGGFYSSDVHGPRIIEVPDPDWTAPPDDPDAPCATVEIDNPACQIPATAVAISAETHAALLAAQSAGKVIVAGDDGAPIAIDPVPITEEAQAILMRADRDQRIADIEWRRRRYLDQTVLGGATDDSAAQYAAVLTYIQALRDVPQQVGFPNAIDWPVKPA